MQNRFRSPWLNVSENMTNRWTFADEAMRSVTSHSTGASIAARFPLTAIKHFVTALTWSGPQTRLLCDQNVVTFKIKANWSSSLYCTCVSCATLAAVVVRELDAAVCATGVTRVGQAFIDITLTAFPHISGWADAVVPSHTVHTAALVKAFGLLGDGVGEGCAVVNVDLAVHT